MTKAQRWRKLAELGLTATDIAKECDVHRGSIARVLHNELYSPRRALAIARAVGMEVSAVFPKLTPREIAAATRKAA